MRAREFTETFQWKSILHSANKSITISFLFNETVLKKKKKKKKQQKKKKKKNNTGVGLKEYE